MSIQEFMSALPLTDRVWFNTKLDQWREKCNKQNSDERKEFLRYLHIHGELTSAELEHSQKICKEIAEQINDKKNTGIKEILVVPGFGNLEIEITDNDDDDDDDL